MLTNYKNSIISYRNNRSTCLLQNNFKNNLIFIIKQNQFKRNNKLLLMKLIIVIFSIALAKLSDQTITNKVLINVQIGDKDVGSFELSLFGDIVPKTVENFITLCSSGKYNNSPFHRVIPQFMIQGGDFTNKDGTGGQAIFGDKFDDENFKLNHEVGCISMANAGPNTNGSQFFITTVDTNWLNGKHVVFGKVSDNFELIKKLEQYGSQTGKPKQSLILKQCKLVEQ
ncbi:hypothetical protein pb186bvf_015512 [Paramecium bursaria]